ncbi:tetraacyldisaccharide 4'-kinase [Pseudoalteromonas ulvae UL12]|uniref:tetraacyldisaccharide 4'-kinase n=1 Tax=Pseudoalteromonas ulvae TaxID=107327 RepID=UPI00186B98EB|nr:tetraacyldisaccharide 4'-kinase [Pseudoalteromonas ulvae]MBE0363907.1 tetraacyldisaccharide 4'-kinase [Pseudoalteromonas ulvae UL12]
MSLIEKSWYRPFGISWLLFPFSLLFWLLSSLRKYAYQSGLLDQPAMMTPVIVIGNISVGGNGKTPMVIWLTDFLKTQGKSVVVISRGYGGAASSYPLIVEQDTSPSQAGDEPVLIYKRCGVPVIVGPSRVQSIQLANEKFAPDVIISDDGMQHYQMKRAVEICIVDAQRRFGNGFLLPMGPLRETQSRLDSVDFVLENGGQSDFSYRLKSAGFYRVSDFTPIQDVPKQGVAVSAIGNPARFETSLCKQGVETLNKVNFRDHHKYGLEDFAAYSTQPIFMTEKDAVKCHTFAQDNWYFLKVDAEPNEAAKQKIESILITKGILDGL